MPIPTARWLRLSAAALLCLVSIHGMVSASSWLDGLLRTPQSHQLTPPLHRLQRACLVSHDLQLTPFRRQGAVGSVWPHNPPPLLLDWAALASAQDFAVPLRI